MTDAAERLRRRYPKPRVPRPAKVALVGLGVAIAMSWLIWAALVHSRPAVAAQVAAYTVTSDTAISVTISVDRRDPSVPVTCRLIAQAADFQPVAEQQVAHRSEHSTGGRQADRADDDPPGDIGERQGLRRRLIERGS